MMAQQEAWEYKPKSDLDYDWPVVYIVYIMISAFAH
jgi:hypothetical protein